MELAAPHPPGLGSLARRTAGTLVRAGTAAREVAEAGAAVAEGLVSTAGGAAESALEMSSDATVNAWDRFLGGGVADMRPTPRSIIDEGPQRTIYRYRSTSSRPPRSAPILLVPPLAAPAQCFDLHRGCSLAAHMQSLGHPTYMVDYGRIAFSDRELGLEHWVSEVIPRAVETVSEDAGGADVQIVGWCLGGIMSLLSVAGGGLPVRAVATVAAPFDFTRVRLVAPLRPVVELTGGLLGTAVYRGLGGAPAPLVKRGYQLAGADKYVTKPYAIARRLHDREFLAQLEAVDTFTANMHAYPGRTMGQLYHRFFRVNELAGGKLELGDRVIDLADVRVPVLSIAGDGDTIAPRLAVHHVGGLLPNAPRVVLETAPGGHLGVLTGRSARKTTWAHLDRFLAATDPGHPRLIAKTARGPVPEGGVAAA